MLSEEIRNSPEPRDQPCAATTASRPSESGPPTRKARLTAQRARATTGAGVGDNGGPPTETTSFVEALCARHQGWVMSEVTVDLLPIGWRALVERTFVDIAAVVGGRRHVLRRLEEQQGGLAIVLDPDLGAQTGTSTEDADVSHLVDCARVASRRLCQVCGKGARPRPTTSAKTLCRIHARDWEAHVASVPSEVRPSWTDGDGSRTFGREGGDDPMTTRIQLYRPSDVAAGLGPDWDDLCMPSEVGTTEHASHLRRILQRGEAASWRTLAVPTHAQRVALDDLDRRAPHFGEVTALVRRHVDAAINMGLALTLPALMLVGEPGFGKTWYVTRLAAALDLSVRTLAMSSATLGDGLTGAYPVWRNAREGLVARTLLAESVANPIFLVDEIDKPAAYNGEDPYRPFYTLLEPENARSLVDDFLGFAMDASHASWVLAGNGVQNLPPPIVDRLLILTIPEMDDAQRRAVAESVYAEANSSRRAFFDPRLPDGLVDRLAPLTARGMRRALGNAMVRAAAAGRRVLMPDDVVDDHRPTRRPVGFGPWS